MGGTGSVPINPQDYVEETKHSEKIVDPAQGAKLKKLYKSMNQAIREFYEEM